MPNKIATDKATKKAIKCLGIEIARCHEGVMSQSKLAQKIGLPRSNMKYIEDGINAPTAEVYERLIQELSPEPKVKARLDQLYMQIRKTPPPDVCATILQNKALISVLQQINGTTMTKEQIDKTADLFASFAIESEKE